MRENRNDIVILGYGGIYSYNNNGYYCFGLVHNMHMKILKGDIYEIKGSANRAILNGLYAAVDIIRKPHKVHALIGTELGFSKAFEKDSGPNKDICKEIVAKTETISQYDINIYFAKGSVKDIRAFLDKPEKDYRVVETVYKNLNAFKREEERNFFS